LLCAKSNLSNFVQENCPDLEGVLPTTVVFPKAALGRKEGVEAARALSHLHSLCLGGTSAPAFSAPAPSSSSSSMDALLKPMEGHQQDQEQRRLLLPPKHTGAGIWIVKPDYLFGGSGITLHRKPEDAVAHIHSEQARDGEGGGPWVAQKYIERPLLYQGGRKFDVRVNVLLLDTRTVYMYREAFVRTSSVPYAPQGEFAPLDTLEAHITNNCLQRQFDHFGKFEEANFLTLASLQAYLATYAPPQGQVGCISVEKSLRPAWRALAARLFSAAGEALLHCPGTGPGTPTRIFEFFGLDFLLDEDGRTYLLEVNTNPILPNPNDWTEAPTKVMLRDTMEVMERELLGGGGGEPAAQVGGWERVWWQGQGLAACPPSTFSAPAAAALLECDDV
jgi:hypothetical protein